LNGHLHELANADLVDALERVGLEYFLLVVFVEKHAGVVAREAKRHLS
jgi:hypothetical protein